MRQCLCESAEHEADHGEINPAGGGSGGLFVIAHEAAAVHEPTEGAFNHPAFGQHMEAGHPGESLDDLHHQLGMLRPHPGGELGTIEAAVHPEFEEFGIVGQDSGQQGAGSLAFGAIGGFEGNAQQQAEGIHQQETLAALGFLGGIVADGTAVGTGADGLAVETGSGGLGVLANGLPHLGAEAVVEPGQQAVAAPPAEMMIDRLPRREVFGQEPPLGAGLGQIEDGIEHFTQGGARPSAFFGGGQEAAKQVPLVVGEVGVVSGDFHRLNGAAANENLKNSQSNQAFSAVFFFKQPLRNCSCLSHTK